jgi:RNA polymerase sigma factor (sigma-70 family)
MSSCEPADRELVARARRGDRRSFATLIGRHYLALLGTCRRTVGSAELARDAAQEAVLVAILGLDRLREDDRFGSWLIGIGLNVCRTLLRDRFRRTGSFDGVAAASRPGEATADPAGRAEMADIAMHVRRAIAALPAGQRAAVELFYLEGLTHAEAAELLGTAPGAIKTRLHKARRSLRAPLTDVWKEYFAMEAENAELIPMHVAGLRRSSAPEPSALRDVVLVLEEDGGERRLPIWIGVPEATGLAVVLDGVELPRPGVFEFASRLLSAAGSELREVRIVELTDFTFYAHAVLGDGTVVDARPSDALTLALHVGAPIYVAAAVIAQAEQSPRLPEDAGEMTEGVTTIADETRAQIQAEADRLATLRGRPE